MTREEAIKYLKEMKDGCNDTFHKVRYVTKEETLDMAIKALEQEPITKNDLGVDLISREQAKAVIRDKFKDLPSRVEINTILNELPSVTPQEPKTGNWISTYGNVECSVCGSVKDSREVGKATHYCDFCGAKMVEPQESEAEDG